MAGTIVADTLQNGAGTSTSMDNAINGSAKAWVSWVGSTGAVRASYGVSSVSRTGTGAFTITFTNAFSDTNYCFALGDQSAYNNNSNGGIQVNPAVTITTTTIGVMTGTPSNASLGDFPINCIACWR